MFCACVEVAILSVYSTYTHIHTSMSCQYRYASVELILLRSNSKQRAVGERGSGRFGKV